MGNKGQNNKDFIELRNNTIYLLHTQVKLRFTDISNLEVQQVVEDGKMIHLKRGNRIFKVALSKEISENLQLLCLTRDDKEKVFYSDRSPIGISRTMVQKIIANIEGKSINRFIFGTDLREEPNERKYHVRKIYDKFVVCYNNRPVPSLSMRVKDHAEQIANIMNLEMRNEVCV